MFHSFQRRLHLFWLALLLLPALASCTVPAASASSLTVSSSASLSVVGRPSISVQLISQVLVSYHSPAVGSAQALYDDGVTAHIDPVFALAFFLHESSFGTQGVARVSFSLGNLRCIADYPCPDGYAHFPTWEAGFQAWYTLVDSPLYVGAGLVTVPQIVHRYAPSADHNDEQSYIQAVTAAVVTWRAGRVLVTSSRGVH